MPRFRPASLLVLGLAASSFAQESPPQIEPELPPGVPAPGAAPAAGQEAPPLSEQKITEPIEEPKLDGTQLAGLYRKYTGRRVIVSSAAATAEFSFVQDASPNDPLTYGEAAELLRKAATIENFIFVPDPTDPNLDILTLATAGLNPKNRGINVYSEGDELPEGDAVISYVMNFQYLKPDTVVTTFQQVIGQFGPFGSIAPVPNASAVVITENTSLIRKLVELKEQIDKPSSQIGTRFIDVQYADVTELAETLNQLLNTQQSTQQSAPARSQRATSQPAAAPAPGVEMPQIPGQPGGGTAGEETPPQIVPDPRTNRIFAMGRPVDLLFIEGLVREFDTPSDQRNFLRRKLKFLKVSEFLPVAEDALTRAFTGTGGGAGASGQGGAGGAGSTRSSNRGNNTAATGGAGGMGGMGGGGAFGSGGAGGSSRTGGISGSSGLGDPQVNSAPESVLVGRTLLVADNITNSVVVQGPPSGLEIVERLLDQIDVQADQVMISTVFGQLSLGKSHDTGVNWLRAFRGNDYGGLAGGLLPGGAPSTILPDDMLNPIVNTPGSGTGGSTVPGTAGIPGALGLSLYGRMGSLAGYLNLLQTSTDFTILSRPSIFTSNNQKGTISSGRRVAIPTNSNSFSGGGVSTNVEYRDVVLKLDVVPLINSKDEITLQIYFISDEIEPGAGQNIEGLGNVPTISTRELLTTVTVPNNQTIVLGGLITSSTSETVTGVPILSSIPVVRRLFSNIGEEEQRSELMIFIQPSIIHNDRALDDVQADMDRRYTISGDARVFADGPGVIPPPDGVLPQKGAVETPVKTTPKYNAITPPDYDPSKDPFRR